MIKRIIIDIDGTILDTNTDLIKAYSEFTKNVKLSVCTEDIYEIIDEYDRLDRNFDRDNFISFVNEGLKTNLSEDDFNIFFNIYSHTATFLNNNTANILENLSKNYEVVALSNWYVNQQRERLKTCGILKYFKEVYGFENAGMKPKKEAFDIACNGLDYDKVLIIGDSIRNDIEVPSKLGIKVIYFNPRKENSIYDSISSLDELIGL